MADSATSDYYEQLVHDNQDLQANGVSGIELVGLEWGTITSRDRTAIASVYETWITTHADTTAEQSPGWLLHGPWRPRQQPNASKKGMYAHHTWS